MYVRKRGSKGVREREFVFVIVTHLVKFFQDLIKSRKGKAGWFRLRRTANCRILKL